MTAVGRSLGRRPFGLSIGAAILTLSAGPAAAEFVAGDVEIDGPGAAMQGYHARPAGTGPFPCVMVVGDFGANAWTADLCRRLATAGYLAVAPDPWGGPQELPPAESERVLDRAIDWAGRNGCDKQRVGLVGFGRGGRTSWLLDMQSAALKAVVVWGGPLVDPDRAGTIRAPLLALYGKNDKANTRAALLAAETKALAAGRTAQVVVYAGASANFGTGDGGTANQAAALDGWNRMVDWFRQHGVG